jgi:hypothetical protein
VRASLDARGASFEVFANVSSQFKERRLSGAAYLAKVTAMGLEAEHIKELASLMPDEALRLELRRAIAAGERARARKEGGDASSVDAAAALLFGGNNRGRAESSSASSSKTWDCPSCTFRNQAASVQCDVCDGARAVGAARGDGAGASGPAPGGGGGGKGGKGKKKARGAKISLTAVGGTGVGGLDAFIPGREKAVWGA